MAQFYYQTINSKGKKEEATIEAASQEEAKSLLRQQKVIVLHFSSEKRGTFLSSLFSKDLSEEQLYLFTSQLAELTCARVPLFQSLTALSEQTQGQKSGAIIQAVMERIKEGQSLSEALSLYPKSFPPLYSALIKAGERIGSLDKSLTKLASFLSQKLKSKKKLTTALLYPLLLALFSCFVIIIMLTFVIPSLETLFDQEQVNRFTAVVMGASHLFTKKWHLFLGLITVTIASGLYLLKKPSLREKKERLLFRLPFLKGLFIKIAIARFTRTFASLLEGGVSMIEALRIAKAVLPFSFLEKEITHVEKRIIEGSHLSRELQQISWMPRLVCQMVAIGEESGSLTSMLESIAHMYEEDVEKNITRLSELAQPIILLVMGGIVGLIMLSILLPITSTTHLG